MGTKSQIFQNNIILVKFHKKITSSIVADTYRYSHFHKYLTENLPADAFESDPESGNNENVGQTSPGGQPIFVNCLNQF